MLSKDSRLRLVEICCRMRLGRKVTLLERVRRNKMIQADYQAANLAELLK